MTSYPESFVELARVLYKLVILSTRLAVCGALMHKRCHCCLRHCQTAVQRRNKHLMDEYIHPGEYWWGTQPRPLFFTTVATLTARSTAAVTVSGFHHAVLHRLSPTEVIMSLITIIKDKDLPPICAQTRPKSAVPDRWAHKRTWQKSQSLKEKKKEKEEKRLTVKFRSHATLQQCRWLINVRGVNRDRP